MILSMILTIKAYERNTYQRRIEVGSSTGQPCNLKLWKLSTGDILEYRGAVCVGSHWRRGVHRVRLPASGLIRASAIYLYRNKQHDNLSHNMDKTISQYDDNFIPGEIFNIEVSNVAAEMASVEDSSLVFDEDANIRTTPVPNRKGMAMMN